VLVVLVGGVLKPTGCVVEGLVPGELKPTVCALKPVAGVLKVPKPGMGDDGVNTDDVAVLWGLREVRRVSVTPFC